MIEPLQALFAEIERLPEDRQLEAAKLLNMFVQGRITFSRLDDNEPKMGAPSPGARR